MSEGLRIADVKKRIAFKKSLGQNFLIDGNISRKIVRACELSGTENVLEIGPGGGALTGYLLTDAAYITAIEIDTRFVQELTTHFADRKRLHLIRGNILKIGDAVIAEKKSWVIVGNLPYHITSPVLFKLIEWQASISRAIVMVQKEVGERIAARPKTRLRGFLSVVCQYYCRVEKLFSVPRTVFFPRPKVDSLVLRLQFHKQQQPFKRGSEDGFIDFVKHCFQHRRKQIKTILRTRYGIRNIEIPAGLSETQRAEDFGIDDFLSIYACIASDTAGHP